jgi:hypothetical protein
VIGGSNTKPNEVHYMDESRLSDWSHLWESGDYVLYQYKESPEGELDACTIYNTKEHSIVRIENDTLYISILRRMKEAGVPITRTRPPGENFFETAQNVLGASGMDWTDFDIAYADLKKMKKEGKSLSELQTKLQFWVREKGKNGAVP